MCLHKPPSDCSLLMVGYDIRTASTGTACCGGVTLMAREKHAFTFTVGNEKLAGNNCWNMTKLSLCVVMFEG